MAQTRPELQLEKGSQFQFNCLKCGNLEDLHVNNVFAEPSNILLVLGTALGIGSAILLWSMYGAIGGVLMMIPVLFWQQENSKSRIFNSYKVKK